MQAFKEGFETVFPLSSLSCFTPEEVYYQIFLRRTFEPLWVTCNIKRFMHLKRKHLKVYLLIFTNIYYIKFLVRLHGEYNILVKFCGYTT